MKNKNFASVSSPVTCHLTCPVTDFINKNMQGESLFDPVRFNGWPELKEAYLSGYTPATFLLAPMAMALREQGVPLKIVYLGHRDGTAMMVSKDSQIYRIEDLKGKTIAVPNRYSNQRLLIFKALREHGMTIADVTLAGNAPARHAGGVKSPIRWTPSLPANPSWAKRNSMVTDAFFT